jgi:two-component system OmpR family response regulator
MAVIIEDDADIRHLLESVLTQAGFDVIATSNGHDGIQAVRAYEPIVTTLDVSMPGMDGFEVAKRLRTFSQTYIVMLTARDEEIDTLQGLEAGADDYLTKPFRPRELRARIDAMLRRPRMASADEPVAAVAAAPIAAPVAVAPAAVAPVSETPAFVPSYAPPVAEPAARTGAHAAPGVPDAAPPAERETSTDGGEGWIGHNGLRLNREMRLVSLDGRDLDLTRTEFDLLVAVVESKRRVRTKADLALLLRGESYVTAYYVTGPTSAPSRCTWATCARSSATASLPRAGSRPCAASATGWPRPTSRHSPGRTSGVRAEFESHVEFDARLAPDLIEASEVPGASLEVLAIERAVHECGCRIDDLRADHLARRPDAEEHDVRLLGIATIEGVRQPPDTGLPEADEISGETGTRTFVPPHRGEQAVEGVLVEEAAHTLYPCWRLTSLANMVRVCRTVITPSTGQPIQRIVDCSMIGSCIQMTTMATTMPAATSSGVR